jgi:hypothetical protein
MGALYSRQLKSPDGALKKLTEWFIAAAAARRQYEEQQYYNARRSSACRSINFARGQVWLAFTVLAYSSDDNLDLILMI